MKDKVYVVVDGGRMPAGYTSLLGRVIPVSRTIRRYIGGTGRDGKQDWPTIVARDDRATGLRVHKRDRRVARVSLKSPGTAKLCLAASAAATASGTVRMSCRRAEIGGGSGALWGASEVGIETAGKTPLTECSPESQVIHTSLW